MYKGWISYSRMLSEETARAELEGMGITLGPLDRETQTFEDCLVSEAAFDKLDSVWGPYVWGLRRT